MRRAGLLVVALALLATVVACSADKLTHRPQAATASAPATHPFTGRPGEPARPVLAVKVENTKAGKPQLGLKSADIVYVEQVEGGLTRLMAIFSSKLPEKVGPVRSARISDLHLMSMFGKPAFAYSGAQHKMLPYIAKASLFDVSDGHAEGAYSRQPGRVAPYNLFADTERLLKAAPEASKAKGIGFTFGDAPKTGGVEKKQMTVRWPAATFDFRWSPSKKQWMIWQDGKPDLAAEGGQQSAPTVVVQYVKTTRSKFHDKFQSYTPLMRTVGKGDAIVLRDGKAYQAKWSRASEQEGTVYTTPDGQPMNFAPGQVWVALAAKKPVMP